MGIDLGVGVRVRVRWNGKQWLSIKFGNGGFQPLTYRCCTITPHTRCGVLRRFTSKHPPPPSALHQSALCDPALFLFAHPWRPPSRGSCWRRVRRRPSPRCYAVSLLLFAIILRS